MNIISRIVRRIVRPILNAFVYLGYVIETLLGSEQRSKALVIGTCGVAMLVLTSKVLEWVLVTLFTAATSSAGHAITNAIAQGVH